MKTKLSTRASVAAVAALMSGSALAVGPATTVEVEAFISGATAQDVSLISVLNLDNGAGGFCDPAQPTTVYELIVPDGGEEVVQDVVVACTLVGSAVTGWTNGDTRIAVHKFTEGGSSQGVYAVNDPVGIPAGNSDQGFLDMSVASRANCVINTQIEGTDGEYNNADAVYGCRTSNGVTVNSVPPDAGLSDVEPGLFIGANKPSSFAAYGTDFSGLNVLGTNQVIFGVIVNSAFRDALQAIQGLTPGSETLANMPTLSTAQVQAIFTGDVQQTWNNLTDDAGTGIITAAGAPYAPVNSVPHVCVRGNGSGTNATFRANIPRQECGLAGSLSTTTGAPPFLQVVSVVAGSSDMDACVAGGDGGYAGPGGGVSPDAWVVGYNSTERNASLSNDYRFVKIDNVAPRADNANRGIYTYWGEATFQYRDDNSTYENFQVGATVYGPSLEALYLQIGSSLADPAILGTQTPIHTWGPAGNLALSINGNAPQPNGGYLASNPVNVFTKTSGSGVPNNCLSPRIDSGNATYKIEVVE